MDNIKIGKLIAKRRKKKGLTQSQLAEHLGVSNKTISKWETGGGLPDISLLIDLADALNISIDNLLKGNDAQEDTFDFDHSFIIKKKYYRQFLCDQYFTNHMYWIIDVFALLLILAGIAVLPLKIYFSNYFAILAKISILLGIIGLLIPLFIILYQVGTFHPLEVFYVFKEDKIVYLNDGEEMTHDLHQFYLIEKKSFAYLKNGKKIIWLSRNDIDEIQQKVKKENVKNIKLRFAGKLILFIIAISTLVLQLGYVIVLKNFGFEYIHDQYEILFYIIVLWAVIGLWMIIRKSGKQTLLYMFVSIMAIFLINICLKANSPIQVIDSFSPDFHQRAVLKYDTFHENLSNYHYTYLCFAKKTETVHASKMIGHKGYWLTNDCYLFTYQDLQQNQDVYVSTFGDRGNGISYYYVAAAMQGNWYQADNDKNPFTVIVENGKITVKHNETSVFTGNEIQQNGTIALTLYKNDHPQYVIVLDENCYLEDNGLVNKQGTITVFDVNDFSSGTLYCGTYKEDQEEQAEIDENMRNSMVKIVNEMNLKLQDDPQLNNLENSYSLFKLETDLDDYFNVSKEAYLMHQSLYSDNSMLEKGQINNIKIIAGDINDFYVELNVEETVKGQSETETGIINAHYRIKKGEGCYLVANITYRMPGSIGLKYNDPVIEKDTTQDLNYAF